MAVYTDVTVQIADVNGATAIDLGTELTAVDAPNGNKVASQGGRVLVIFQTDAGGTLDVTFDSVPCPHGREGDLGPISLVASKLYVFGPFTPGLFNQVTGVDVGYLHIDYANLVGVVKIAAISL